LKSQTKKLPGRGGLFFFLRYVDNIGFYSLFDKKLQNIKSSPVGKPSIVVLFADTVVWDNEDATKREGIPAFENQMG